MDFLELELLTKEKQIEDCCQEHGLSLEDATALKIWHTTATLTSLADYPDMQEFLENIQQDPIYHSLVKAVYCHNPQIVTALERLAKDDIHCQHISQTYANIILPYFSRNQS